MADRGEDINRQRLAKLERVRNQNIDPYPTSYRRTHTIQKAVELFEKRRPKAHSVRPRPRSLAGRIIARRGMGKATFLDIRDGSGKIQVYLRKDRLRENYNLLRDLDIGDFIGVRGNLFRTATGETTVDANELILLTKSLRPLPEKWHGLADVEKRYRQRYLDLLTNESTRRTFSIRARVISAMRRFLDKRGFLEVETPMLLPVAAGAMARPFVTHHQALDRELYLRIATELHLKRLIIGGLDKVYEIGRIFRNEGIDTQHNPEFTSLESYEAYADYNDVMNMVEEMVHLIALEVVGDAKATFGDHIIDFSPPWRRAYLLEEIRDRSGIDIEDYPDVESLSSVMAEKGVQVEPPITRGRLIDKLLSEFVEPHLIQPTFLVDYPIETSPLAKQKRDNPKLVERFEGFVGGMEIANAFTELNDPIEQRNRFLAQEEIRATLGDEEVDRLDEEFLVALEHGMPPTGGLGMGIDRLVMFLTNQQSIREVILFPQLRSK